MFDKMQEIGKEQCTDDTVCANDVQVRHIWYYCYGTKEVTVIGDVLQRSISAVHALLCLRTMRCRKHDVVILNIRQLNRGKMEMSASFQSKTQYNRIAYQ